VYQQPRVARAERQHQIADVTLGLVAKEGIHGATISRIASAAGLSRSALYRCFPNREAMLGAAFALLVERVPRWVARSSGETAYEHLLDMGNQFSLMGISESFTRPWFQFAAARGTGKLAQEMATRHLVFIRDFAILIEQGKRDGSIREDVDTNVIAWTLMMWAWGADVARMIELAQVIGTQTSIDIFRRMIDDIASREVVGPD
jgi:TetR/AcrR family transcriptional regulator, transcriptional repressor of aconitase